MSLNQHMLCHYVPEINKAVQRRRFRQGGVCGRETPSGGNTGIVAFADHLHALKPIEHSAGEGKPNKAE